MFENTAVADLIIGRSTVRQRILALLIPETTGRLHLREIQRRAGTSPGTASRELARLVAAGLIDREKEGAQVYFKASTTPFAAMMRSLLVLAPDATVTPKLTRVPRAAQTPIEPAAPQQVRDATIADVTLGDASTPALPAAGTPDAVDAPTSIVATTGAAMEGPLADIVASAISQLTAAPASRPAEAAAGDGAWSGIPDPELIEIIRRRAAADPFGLKIARRLADSVESIYGERLRGMYMFGLRAAGPADDTADVETIIVLDRVERYGAELERTSHACAALSHECSVVVSRVFVSEDDWANRADGSLPIIRAEAVVA
jgi:DNA-binding transcriptional ArsR family regulator